MKTSVYLENPEVKAYIKKLGATKKADLSTVFVRANNEFNLPHDDLAEAMYIAIEAGVSPENKETLLEVIQLYSQAHSFDAVVPISARTGQGVDELLDVLEGFLPQGPQLFPEDMTSDQPERQMMAEILREKLLLCLDKEIPHGTAVEITRFSEREDEVIEVDATIYCEKNSHKGIIIGKGGAMLKKVSSLARQDMERFMGTKIYLQTWVKVKENWRDNPAAIQNFGYRQE